MFTGLNKNLNENDPARFSDMNKKFTFEQKQYILKLGPCQPSAQEMPFHKFPKTLSFHAKWYTKTLPDGSIGTRKWLSYSISKDKIYCLYCILFGKSPKKAWTNYGVYRWKDGVFMLASHETSVIHIAASIDATIQEQCSPLLPVLKEKKKLKFKLIGLL